MPLGPEDLFIGYAGFNERELLEIARSYDDLTGSAQQALREEFSRRGLDPPALGSSDDSQPATRQLITIHRYRDLSEAIVARSYLESSGIPVFLCDENLVRLDWQISNFIGGIRLQVDAEDGADALELLAQPTSSPIEYSDDAEFVQPRCPICGSPDIAFQGSSRGAALASLYLFAVPLPLGRETWLCNACGARWEEQEQAQEDTHQDKS